MFQDCHNESKPFVKTMRPGFFCTDRGTYCGNRTIKFPINYPVFHPAFSCNKEWEAIAAVDKVASGATGAIVCWRLALWPGRLKPWTKFMWLKCPSERHLTPNSSPGALNRAGFIYLSYFQKYKYLYRFLLRLKPARTCLKDNNMEGFENEPRIANSQGDADLIKQVE